MVIGQLVASDSVILGIWFLRVCVLCLTNVWEWRQFTFRLRTCVENVYTRKCYARIDTCLVDEPAK